MYIYTDINVLLLCLRLYILNARVRSPNSVNVKASKDGQGTKWRRKIAENFNRLSRMHKRYRRQTDGRAIAYSERIRELTFAKI